jgi:hypothetical protein
VAIGFSDGRTEPASIHPNVFHELLETVPATGWQVGKAPLIVAKRRNQRPNPAATS